MIELYLRLIEQVLTPVLLLLALYLHLRGHDAPGGGFIAGLMATTAFYVRILSRGSAVVQAELGRFLRPGIGVGLMLAGGAAALGVIFPGEFFQSVWGPAIPLGSVSVVLSTPFLFDTGVLIVVACFAVSYLLGLSETIVERQTPDDGDGEDAEESAGDRSH